MSTFDFKTAPLVSSGLSTSTIVFGAQTGQTSTDPNPITLPAVSGYLATLAEELTNKTLTSSVGKGTWTASGTWTLPALTLGGTVSGGGQQLNNIIIGTSTPLAGTFTALTAASATITQGTITDPAPQINGTVTWNDAADSFTAWKLDVTNTNSASTSYLIDLQLGGASQFRVRRDGYSRILNGISAGSGSCLFYDDSGNDMFSITNASLANYGCITRNGIAFSTSPAGAAADLFLARDAAATLALRNSTTAQTFNIYGTYTDASNYEQLLLTSQSFGAEISFKNAGTGTYRELFITANAVRFQTGATYAGKASRWQVNPSGHFLAETDNTYDIGASGATRPRTGYFGTSVITPALRIDATPSAIGTGVKTISNAADGTTNFGHYLVINMNGTPYYIPCSATAPT